MTRARSEGLGLALAGALAAWAAGCSWMPLFAAPARFLVPGAIFVLVIAVIGWSCRLRSTRPVLVAVVQVVVAFLLLAVWFSPASGSRGPDDLAGLARALAHGARQINAYASPAPERFGDVGIFLCACLVLLAIGIDVVAGSLRRAPLAGLLLLLAVTVPISVLVGHLPVWVFVLTGAAYLALLALAHHRDLRSWGRSVTSPAPTGARRLVPGVAVGAGCLAVAVLASGLAPVSSGVFSSHGQGTDGDGTRGITLDNPLIDLRRDLVQMSHTPLLTARTDDPDPSYVQLSVLDDFTGSQWRASERKLPEANRLPGELPPAPGTGPYKPGRETRWTMTLAQTFKTSWLPVPTPTTRVDISGDWRYDTRNLDIVDTSKTPASGGLTYTVRAFHPDYDARTLDEAGAPVGEATDHMTDVPADMPAVIASTARRVTRGADTEYEELARLQNWFRSTGGFTYSTRPAPGSGMALLAAFITRDKVGYCEQFAAAMAVMARTLGIPSRVVVGFLRPTGEPPRRGEVEFTSDDLHAWPQFYFSGSGWVTFDPTPGARTGRAPAYTRQTVRNDRAQPTEAATPRATRQPKATKPQRLPDAATPARQHGGHGAWWLLLLPALALLALAPRALRSRQRRRRLGVPAGAPAAVLATGCWAEIRATSHDLGLGWEDGRSPRQAFAVLQMRVSDDPGLRADLDWLCTYIERAWYAPSAPVGAADADRVRDIVSRWRTSMRDLVPEPDARRERWLPSSLVDRSAPGSTDPYRDVAEYERV